MDLLEFLALECPLLLPTARKNPSRQALHDSIDWAYESAGSEKARDALHEQIDGYFRREEIRASLTREERVELYRVMLLSRALDGLLKVWFDRKEFGSPQKGFRATGQEAAAGLALRLRRDGERGDIACPLIRGLPVTLMYGDDPLAVALAQTGKKGTPMEGRDLHTGDLSKGLLPPAAPLAIGTLTLLGMAYASKLRKEDRVFLSIMGEGGTSHGEWHEAINFASVRRLPMIFVVENNHWALGTHWREQTAASRFALKAVGYGIPGITIDGNDPDEVAAAAAWAAERARGGAGPALLELLTYRRSGHAHHDDVRYHGLRPGEGYEFPEERTAWEARDPIVLYERRLLDEGVLTPERNDELQRQTERRIDVVAEAVKKASWPEPGAGSVWAVRTEAAPAAASLPTRPMSYDQAIRQAIQEAMARDSRVVLIGEDVGGRYGGAFAVTRKLAEEFGGERVLNAPLAESAILGCGTGAAMAGLRPIVEMQFADFVACGFNILVNGAAKVHWRYGRPVPMVVRLPYGASTAGERLLGGGPYHSQCPEAWFLRVSGLKIVAPSTASDAKGLLTAALRDNNPVLFLEAKGLYGSPAEEVPLGDYEVPIGKAIVRRAGRDVSLITYGAMTLVALEAARLLQLEGIDVEVVELRTLAPLDEELLLASVAKTHRAVLLHEDSKRGGVGAELAAILAERALFELEAPVLRVAAPDTPVPYAPPLERAHLPGVEAAVAALRAAMRS